MGQTAATAVTARSESSRCLVPAVHDDDAVPKMGLFAWNLETGSNTWSPELYRLYGVSNYGSQSLRDWRKFVLPDDWDQTEAALQRALRTGEYRAVFRIRRRDDRRIRLIEACGSLIRNADGTPVALLGTNVDVTEAADDDTD